MTGYGHGSIESRWGHFEVTLRSLNHRFCSININVPEFFEAFEIQIQELIKSHISRGRIEYRLNWEQSDGFESRPVINQKVVESYLASLKEVMERFQLDGNVSVDIVSRLPGIFTFERGMNPEIEEMWDPVAEVTVKALNGLIEMREREGGAMRTSITEMLEMIGEIQEKIEDLMPGRIERARKRMLERVEEVLKGKGIDEARMLMEITLLAEKWDISEELTRIRSHLSQFEGTINEKKNVGRRLHFLLQELQREVNTITSKAYDVEISHRAVEIKEIIEKIREQVENIE